MIEVTQAELAVTRRILEAQEAWNQTIGEAFELHFDILAAAFPDIAEWHAKIPAYLAPRDAELWLRSQRVQAGWHVVSPERALELAKAALDKPKLPPLDDFIRETSTGRIAPKAGGGYQVYSGRGTGRRLTADEEHRIVQMLAQNQTANQIAMYIGCSTRSVDRVRANHANKAQSA